MPVAPRKQGLFYGWIVLAVAMLVLITAYGMRASFGVFVKPWETEFHVDRSAVSAISAVGFLVQAISLPFIGKLIDRYGARAAMSSSLLMLGLSFIVSSLGSGIWQLYIVYGIFSSIAFSGASVLPATVVVARWFVARRGLAIGIITAGLAATPIIMAPPTILFVRELGWRPTMLGFGILLLVLVFPTTLLLMRSKPSDMGLEPYGAEYPARTGVHTSRRAKQTTGSGFKFLTTRAFWFLALPYFVCGYTTSGFIDTHLVPLAQALQFSDSVIATALSVLAAFNMVGTLAAGYLSDRWTRKHILTVIYAERAVALLFLLTVRDPAMLILFSVMFGIADFGTTAPVSALTADYFGGASLGLIFGFISLTHQAGSAAGAFLPGKLYDLTGSYHVTLISAAVLLGLATILSLALPGRHPERPAKPAMTLEMSEG